MNELYQPFLSYLPTQASILDLGSGSGRDSLNFKNMGYHVEAIDSSITMVEETRKHSQVPTRFLSFYDLHDNQKYDGIWACASLLHCERTLLPKVIQNIIHALKNTGVCYMSFKYGSSDREKDGRYFVDMNEQLTFELLRTFDNIMLLQQWITIDKRPDRNELWLNIIFRKI
jgi:SAM-dependent methyltransferase